MSRRVFGRSAVVLSLVVALSGCGKKDSPTSPGGGSNCSVIVGNKGTVTAQIDGAAFSGITPTGGATQTPNVITLFGQTTDNTTLTLGTTSLNGTSTFGAGIVNGSSISLQTRSCTAGTGLWMAVFGSGSGTITIQSTPTGATGTFSGTLVAVPNSGATGTKTITGGQFNVTF